MTKFFNVLKSIFLIKKIKYHPIQQQSSSNNKTMLMNFFSKYPPFYMWQMDNVEIRKRTGSLHFIRFQTTDMGNFLSLAKQKGMAELVTTVCATGGGAYKFENDFREVSNER